MKFSMRLMAIVASVLLVTGLATPVHADTDVAPDVATQVSGDAAWSWWTSPKAVVDPADADDYYFTGITSYGAQRLYHVKDGQMTYFTIRSTNADEHNAPAVSIEPGKPTLLFYAGHSDWVRYRVSPSDHPTLSANGSSSDFGPELQLPFTDKGTYVQVLRKGDKVVVLTRYWGGTDAGWFYVTSNDSGQTWTEPKELFDSEKHQAYLWVRQADDDDDALDVVAYFHPKYGDTNKIGYKRLTFSQFFNGAATTDDGTSGFTLADLDVVWQQTATDDNIDSAEAGSMRLFDVAERNGKVAVLYGTWNSTNSIPTYYVAYKPDSDTSATWPRQVIGSAGGVMASGEGNYVPGTAFDHRVGSSLIYVGYRDSTSGNWRLDYTSVNADGTLTPLNPIFESPAILARPVQIGSSLLVQRLDKYNSYTNYRISVWDTPTPATGTTAAPFTSDGTRVSGIGGAMVLPARTGSVKVTTQNPGGYASVKVGSKWSALVPIGGDGVASIPTKALWTSAVTGMGSVSATRVYSATKQLLYTDLRTGTFDVRRSARSTMVYTRRSKAKKRIVIKARSIVKLDSGWANRSGLTVQLLRKTPTGWLKVAQKPTGKTGTVAFTIKSQKKQNWRLQILGKAYAYSPAAPSRFYR